MFKRLGRACSDDCEHGHSKECCGKRKDRLSRPRGRGAMLRMAEHRQKSGKLPHLIHDRARCPRAVQRSIPLKMCHFH